MLLGVLGGGQLGRMLALAAAPLGVRVRCYDPDADACAGDVCELHTGAWDDAAALHRFARGCDAVTLEFENVPASALRAAGALAPAFPDAGALEVAQDRALEKTYLARAGLRLPAWESVDDPDGLRRAVRERVGLPCVLKTRRGGYDGKGQAVIRAQDDIAQAWSAIGGRPAVVEAFVPFTREVSLVAVRGIDGAFAHYPLTTNRHERGILRESVAGEEVGSAAERNAAGCVRQLMDGLGYVGVLAVEFFDVGGELLANEMAPRVHNSGHWTIDGAMTSQFENHVRAVLGLPLGACDARGVSVMVNFIGEPPGAGEVLSIPGARPHLYGKEGRAGRKVGHATVTGPSRGAIEPAVAALRALAERCEQQA